MKILLVHNLHHSGAPSGDDTVFNNEVELLQKNGHRVFVYKRTNDELFNATFLKKIPMWAQTLWSFRSYCDIKEIIHKEKPDIAHFHNIFPLISPSGYYACQELGVPVVQTLHDFRFLCPMAFFFRNGKICEECPEKGFWKCIKYACFRNSRFQSAIASFIFWFHMKIGTWIKNIDLFICLTNFQRLKFIEFGFPQEKIVIKPNFLSQRFETSVGNGNYAIFIGRLSEEKGVEILLQALNKIKPIPLKIVGDGHQKLKLQQVAKELKLENAEFLGMKPHDETIKILKNARFLIMPSVWYETFGLTIIEAFACGKPVVASNLGAMADLVKHGETGLLFEPGNADDLATKVKWLWEHPEECQRMGANARKEYEQKYTAERNIQILMNIYQKAIDLRKRRRRIKKP